MITERTTQIQTQLETLLHCRKCGDQMCEVDNCSVFKSVIKHMDICSEGRSCQEVHCASSRQILGHWNACTDKKCIVCGPVKLRYQQHQPQYEAHMIDTNTWINRGYTPPDLVDTTADTPHDTSLPTMSSSPVTHNAQPEHNPQSVHDTQQTPNGQNTYNTDVEYKYYSQSSRVHNLSDEMKLAIRDAVQTSINALLPRIEQTITNTIRVEVANMLQGHLTNLQTPEHMEPPSYQQHIPQSSPHRHIPPQMASPRHQLDNSGPLPCSLHTNLQMNTSLDMTGLGVLPPDSDLSPPPTHNYY